MDKCFEFPWQACSYFVTNRSEVSLQVLTLSMLGGLLGSQSSSKDFGENMLSSVARQAIQQLFTRSESVDVSIRCAPASKILQGIVDSFQMKGRGLVIKKMFEAEAMEFETDAVSLDMSGLIGGKIRLKQATHAIATVTMTEAGINKAFTADLVEKHLRDVTSEEATSMSGGDPVSFRDVQMKLLPNQRVKITAKTDLPNRDDLPISLSAKVTVERRRRVVFTDLAFEPDDVPEDVQWLSEAMIPGFIGVLNQMVDLERFDLDGVSLRVNQLDVKGKQLLFNGYAEIEHFPGM
ncbi:hypothetical protein S7335_2434 [Synechococcus sp. PCC 7335]|uniref:LmeA family phospholipid-binding protein n=1 Tax=Synechococcus sp. (strain ATCC 29403 / PCC 7335) TaxID=91464 RepID=UPI00017EDD39|nr:DUF2993 domain-containing protein [Synechococcus sp. PCC 7335]EDX84737.1 hypothetical protein S7335_2434 [Synechococcus sp. PCC 7335]